MKLSEYTKRLKTPYCLLMVLNERSKAIYLGDCCDLPKGLYGYDVANPEERRYNRYGTRVVIAHHPYNPKYSEALESAIAHLGEYEGRERDITILREAAEAASKEQSEKAGSQ